MKNILVIDTGSSSMRGLLFDEMGTILVTARRTYQMRVPDEETAVQDAEDFRNSLEDICREIADRAGEMGLCVDGISLTSQRSSVIPLDREGKPLAEAMMWYDHRAQYISDHVNKEAAEKIYRTCGMCSTPVLSAPKMRWLLENRRDIYDSAYKLAGIQDYLIFLLTGEFVTDDSLASRTGLMDVVKRQWSEEMLELYGIGPEKLCRLLPAGSIAGRVKEDFSLKTGLAAGIPVVTAGGDQQCSVVGQRLFACDEMGITSGSGSYIVVSCTQPVFDPERRVTLTAASLPGRYVLEASNNASGTVYNWVKCMLYDKNKDISEMNEEILQSPPGANGILMLPDLAGKGCPDWDGAARGCFVNIGFEAEKRDFARAALEGIAAEVAECVEVLRELCGGRRFRLFSTGGLSRFSLYNQIIADMTGLPVTVTESGETTGAGAWGIAAASLGLYGSTEEALKYQPAGGTVYEPEEKLFAFYQEQKRSREILQEAGRRIRELKEHK